MFSPAGAFDPEAVPASRIANAPAPRAELVDIVSTWHDTVHATLGAITVPVHYRQAEIDLLWIVSPEEIEGFGSALSRSSRVDCAMVRGTGHCMDFHPSATHCRCSNWASPCNAPSRRPEPDHASRWTGSAPPRHGPRRTSRPGTLKAARRP